MTQLMLLSPVFASNPPLTPPSKMDPGGRLASPFSGVTLGGLHIYFEKTFLSDVYQSTLTGKIYHFGDPNKGTYWVCFTVNQTQPAQRVWILSDGETGGSEHTITGISAKFIETGKPPRDCPLLPADFLPISLDNDVWLGNSKEDVRSVIGGDSWRDDAWGQWLYEGKIPSNQCTDGFNRHSSLSLRANGGRIDALYANQATSC
jgi:hypothetical protein